MKQFLKDENGDVDVIEMRHLKPQNWLKHMALQITFMILEISNCWPS